MKLAVQKLAQCIVCDIQGYFFDEDTGYFGLATQEALSQWQVTIHNSTIEKYCFFKYDGGNILFRLHIDFFRRKGFLVSIPEKHLQS